MAIAIGAGQRDVRQRRTAGSDALTGGHEQQPPGLDAGDRVELLAEAAEQVGVGLVGLVDLGELEHRKRRADDR